MTEPMGLVSAEEIRRLREECAALGQSVHGLANAVKMMNENMAVLDRRIQELERAANPEIIIPGHDGKH